MVPVDPFDDEFEDVSLPNEKDERRQEYARKHTHEDMRENEIDHIPTPKGKPIPEDNWEDEVENWDDDFDDMPPNIWDDEDEELDMSDGYDDYSDEWRD